MDFGLIAFNALQGASGMAGVINRGSQNCPVTLVPARTDTTAVNTNEATYSFGAQDVLVAVTDYKPTGTPSEPQNLDTIVYDDLSGETITVQVFPPSLQQKCFSRWKGSSVFRVHGKVISRV